MFYASPIIKLIITRRWELTDEYATLLFKSSCYYCGKVPQESNWNGIDRKDNNECYTIKNSRSCCKLCNMMKETYDADFFIEHCRNIVRHNTNILNN